MRCLIADQLIVQSKLEEEDNPQSTKKVYLEELRVKRTVRSLALYTCNKSICFPIRNSTNLTICSIKYLILTKKSFFLVT